MLDKCCAKCTFSNKARLTCEIATDLGGIDRREEECPKSEAQIVEERFNYIVRNLKEIEQDVIVKYIMMRRGDMGAMANREKEKKLSAPDRNVTDLQSMLMHWQERIGLLDWKIVLKENCLPEDLTLEDAKGEAEYNTVIRAAVIRILDPMCYNKERILHFDREQVLVHELLHLKFALLDGAAGELGDKIIHQLIDEFAEVLTGKSIYERNRR